MRIGLVGSHGVGKSTLVKALKEYLPNYTILPEFSREVVKHGIGLNFETTSDTQEFFYKKYKELFSTFLPQFSNSLSSRTILDLTAYTNYFYRYPKYGIPKKLQQETWELFKQHISWWDILIYIPIEFSIQKEDIFRKGQSSHPEYQREIDNNVKDLLLWVQENKKQVKIITASGSVETRVSQIFTQLPELIPNIVLYNYQNETGVEPKKAYPGDAAFDLYSSQTTEILAHSWKIVPTGLHIALPEGYYAQIFPRSSSGLKGIQTHPGIIDSGYRGEVSPIVYNHTDKSFLVKKGERIAQLVISKILSFTFKKVSKLPPSSRGVKGFGSSGK